MLMGGVTITYGQRPQQPKWCQDSTSTIKMQSPVFLLAPEVHSKLFELERLVTNFVQWLQGLSSSLILIFSDGMLCQIPNQSLGLDFGTQNGSKVLNRDWEWGIGKIFLVPFSNPHPGSPYWLNNLSKSSSVRMRPEMASATLGWQTWAVRR